MRKTHLAAALLVFAMGCEESHPQSDPLVPIAEVPPKVMEAARKQLPNFTFDTVYKMKVEGKDLPVYEVRGKDKRGKIREVEVAADGTVIAVE